MRILELPMNAEALLWTVQADHMGQAVSAAAWRCPPPAAFLPVGAGREGAGSGGFYPWPDVSADSASLSLLREPICCPELRKQAGAQGISWCSRGASILSLRGLPPNPA